MNHLTIPLKAFWRYPLAVNCLTNLLAEDISENIALQL